MNVIGPGGERRTDFSHVPEGEPNLLSDSVGRQAAFTIFVHVFYPDVWEEMRVEIETAAVMPFALVVTRPSSVAPVRIPDTSYLTQFWQFETENRGRDILPFLKALGDPSLPATDIALKLHTKRSPHRSDGADWRRFLCRSLLKPDGHGGLAGYALMANEPRIGLIAPEAHLMPLHGRTSINGKLIDDVVSVLHGNGAVVDLTDGRFAAGSMFWFRRSALAPFLSKDIEALFAAETGQLDGTAAHALERLFVSLVESQGLLSAAMENTFPILEASDKPLSTSQLTSLIDRTLISDNPFSLPLRDFWRKNPSLLKLAHFVYAKMPKNVIRAVRAVLHRS